MAANRPTRETAMLLSPWFISNYNSSLTADALHFVLKNALNFSEAELKDLKERTNQALMRLDSTYDDLPLEVQGAFVMEPYFPRKHFNRAFAWLFGKERIEEIDAESFSHHERLRFDNQCYSLDDKLAELQFTEDEYNHIYGEFSKLFDKKHDSYFGRCKEALMRHKHLSLDAFLGNKDSWWRAHSAPLGARAEIAEIIFDEKLLDFKRDWGELTGKDKSRRLMEEMEWPLCFDNLGLDKRHQIHAMIGRENLTLKWLKDIYNHEIPDEVFEAELARGVINKREIKREPDILSDLRLPREMATAIVFSTPSAPAKYALHYFGRKDISEAERERVLFALLDAQINDKLEDGVPAKRAMAGLISRGLLTLSEIELVQDKHQDPYDMRDIIFQWMSNSGVELPPAIQDKWTEHEFCSGVQLLHYHDIPAIVDSMRAHYHGDEGKPGQRAFRVMAPSLVLFNPRWTRGPLLELLDITRQVPRNPKLQETLAMLRKEVIYKLFSESFYPSLGKEDLTGRYGRAEDLLARVLDGDTNHLSEFDINLIIQSRIQLDYCHAEVNLANSLARHPELNERIIAARLQQHMDCISDTPALASSRQRRTL